MKQSLLEMVQSILSDMDSDDIDSLSDTAEALQVASTIRDVYFQMISNQTIPEHQSLAQLESADDDTLVFMKIPDTVSKVIWFKYNKIADGDTDNSWAPIVYKTPPEFLDIILKRSSSDTNVISVVDPDSEVTIDAIRNDHAPSYWTSFDDEYIVCDSYDVAVDPQGLDGTKTLLWVNNIPVWAFDDEFVPDLDDNLFPLLLAEAKSTCFVNLKQTANPKIEKQAKNQRIFASNDKHRTDASQKKSTDSPNFGRRRP